MSLDQEILAFLERVQPPHARQNRLSWITGPRGASVIADIERVANYAAPGEGRDELTPTERKIRFRNEKRRATAS